MSSDQPSPAAVVVSSSGVAVFIAAQSPTAGHGPDESATGPPEARTRLDGMRVAGGRQAVPE